jgi:hypothetical protein
VEDDAVNAAGEREAVEKTFGIANGIFFFLRTRVVWSSDVSYENHKNHHFLFISRAPSAHSNNKQQPKEKEEEEEEEEETKCRFVVVRRINLPPSLSSLAHLSLGSDSRDGVLVFF